MTAEIFGAGAHRAPLQRLPCCVSAVDVIFQVCNCGLLAGNDVLDEIPDRDHAYYLIAFDHGQMANAFVGHQAQTFFDRFTRMSHGNIGRHDTKAQCGQLHVEKTVWKL